MAQPANPKQLELDLEAAKIHGRWLSDEERDQLDEQQRQRLHLKQQQDTRRSKLFVLTGICLLIPPLWPLAFGLTLYLLFPRTMLRIGLFTGLALVTAALGLTALLTALTIWVLTLIF